jgi:hypothetical protein
VSVRHDGVCFSNGTVPDSKKAPSVWTHGSLSSPFVTEVLPVVAPRLTRCGRCLRKSEIPGSERSKAPRATEEHSSSGMTKELRFFEPRSSLRCGPCPGRASSPDVRLTSFGSPSRAFLQTAAPFSPTHIDWPIKLRDGTERGNREREPRRCKDRNEVRTAASRGSVHGWGFLAVLRTAVHRTRLITHYLPHRPHSYGGRERMSGMGRRTTRCHRCGYRVHWNPETREGPTVFFEKGACPSCGRSFEDRAPVSARRRKKRR